MGLCPEHPKRDQNPKFTPLSETTSIPVCFIWEVPPPPPDGTPFTYLQCQTKIVGTLPLLALNQSAKKFVSNSWGLVDFSIRQVNSVLNLPNQQVKCFGTFKLRKNFNQSCSSKNEFGLVETTLGLKMLAVAYHNDNFPSHRVECPGQIIF